MKAIDPGHVYQLDHLDDRDLKTVEILRFVKRVGDNFPGNYPPAHSGTITQEVIRALIDRTKYVNAQKHHERNLLVVSALRSALRHLEVRAAEERRDQLAVAAILQTPLLELSPICERCGHVMCNRDHESEEPAK